jgi:hypothetical protein
MYESIFVCLNEGLCIHERIFVRLNEGLCMYESRHVHIVYA